MRSQRHFLQRSTICYAFLIGQEIRVHWGEASFILRLLNTYPNSRHIGPFSLFPITGSLIGKNTTRPIFRTVAQLCLSQNLCNPLTTPDNLVYPKIHREGIYCSRLCDICTLIFFFSEFGIERCHKISGWGCPIRTNVERWIFSIRTAYWFKKMFRCAGEYYMRRSTYSEDQNLDDVARCYAQACCQGWHASLRRNFLHWCLDPW